VLISCEGSQDNYINSKVYLNVSIKCPDIFKNITFKFISFNCFLCDLLCNSFETFHDSVTLMVTMANESIHFGV